MAAAQENSREVEEEDQMEGLEAAALGPLEEGIMEDTEEPQVPAAMEQRVQMGMGVWVQVMVEVLWTDN